MRPRLYLDEDVLPELARVLRSAGHDVISAHEVAALGIGDEDQLARAAAEGRALLSFNYRHFLRIGHDWFVTGQPHAGIVVSYRQYRRSELRELAKTVATFLGSVTLRKWTTQFGFSINSGGAEPSVEGSSANGARLTVESALRLRCL